MTSRSKLNRKSRQNNKLKALPTGQLKKGDKKQRAGSKLLDDLAHLPKVINKLSWIHLPEPRAAISVLSSSKNFLICLVASIVTYVLTVDQPEMVRRVLATFVLAAGCWLLEVFPIYITGLMIPVALTLLGVFEPTRAFAPFAHPVIFLLLGGLVIGQAIKKHGLDQRLAYVMLKHSNGSLNNILLLIMLTTAFMSMWMSNTVAIAILLPVVLTILTAVPNIYENFKKKVLIGMTVSTTLGGMAMLTGSTPNMIAAAALEGEGGFGFMQWAYYGVPVVLLALGASFLVLQALYPSPKVRLDLSKVIMQEKNIGPMTKPQWHVIIIFGATIALWFFGSEVELILGLPPSISSAAMVSILAVLIMFGGKLLEMKDVTTIQWEIMFLVGGGLLLGDAMIASHAASLIGGSIASIGELAPTVIVLFIFIILTVIITNFISNSATAAIMVPIALETAKALGLNPVPFVMGVGLTASLAFITPVGTPSTAMVYSTGLVPKGVLIKNGVLIGLISCFIVLMIVWAMPVI